MEVEVVAAISFCSPFTKLPCKMSEYDIIESKVSVWADKKNQWHSGSAAVIDQGFLRNEGRMVNVRIFNEAENRFCI